MRLISIAVVAFAAALGVFAADDPATVLARILAEKGMIDSTDLARVEAVGVAGRVDVLSALLAEKGLLTASDMAKLGGTNPPPAHPVPGGMVTTSPQPPPPAPAKPEAQSPPVTSDSKFPVTVYGTLLMNAFYDTSLNNIQDIPLFNGKQGSDPNGNDKSFGMTARQSRIGLRYTGPQIAGGARISGQAEIDFLGGKAAFGNGINMDLVRLRLAFGRLDWNNVALEAGQDWSVFAPLNPTSLAEFAIPALSTSGNLWIRTPQLRVELHNDVSDTTRIRFQIAAVDPDVGDYNTTVFSSSRTPGIGERGRYPGVDSRLGLTTKAEDREFAFGVSSHYGRGKNAGMIGTSAFQVGVDSWGVAIDYSLPFSKLFTFSGEWFVGRALGIFSDAAGESVLPVGTPGQHGVESSGGWSQAQFNFTPKWQMNLTYGIEVERNREVRTGDRNKNQTYLGNVIYKYNPHVNFALEWRRFLTNWKNQRFADETGDHFNLAVAYIF